MADGALGGAHRARWLARLRAGDCFVDRLFHLLPQLAQVAVVEQTVLLEVSTEQDERVALAGGLHFLPRPVVFLADLARVKAETVDLGFDQRRAVAPPRSLVRLASRGVD